ncbi:MAG: PxKF domain-containing protein [Anaerolineales bacterium]
MATSDAEFTRVGGFLDSEPNQNYQIDVFANASCDPTFFGEGQIYLSTFSVTTDSNGRAIFDQLIGVGGVAEPYGFSATATGSNGTSEFSYCRPISTSNVNWADAQLVASGSQTQQYMTDIFQEKWFKFPVQPGSSVSIKLTSLPGSAVSLHTDPHLIYDQLIDPENAPALSAQSSDPAFLPSGSLPSGSLPSGSLPSGSLPSGSLPSGSLPTGYLPSGSLPSGSLPSGSLPSGSLPSGSLPSGSLPSGSLPSGSLPSGSLPSGSLPSGSLPSGSLPSGSLPSGSLPSGSLPSGSLPSGSLPSGSLPSGSLPSAPLPSGSLPSGSLPSGSLDAFAQAARQSLLGISMDPYATVQTIERNTYDLQEDLYVRVVGPYDLNTPFTLEVNVTGGICSAISSVPSGLSIISGIQPGSGSYASLILTDSSRMHGTSTEITTALNDLQTLASRNDVHGLVIDLADLKYERLAFANTQADANLACPSGKNTVAAEIKKVIDAYRAVNPSLQYLVLAGGADVIPFFQVPDVSGLANENEYVPPVKASTASEAGLATNLVQGQDAYGSKLNITQFGYTLALPDLAVGRLVDNASDISAAVNAYIQTNGVITPHSSLVTGYDFVGDAAEAIKTEMDAGTNSTADTLIQAPGLPPTDPTAWTADQLRTKLLAGNYDIAVLSGHFSAGNLLAADYTSQLSAAEIAQSSADLNHVLLMTLGCHGGYSIPASDVLNNISPNPDWAKTFLRKGAAGYIAATGYAYGDTELTEYGERLFVLMSQQMRTGNGPISIGQAVVKAKQQYLAETAQLTGIDQKTLIEMTLYGLPMMKVDMPGARLSAQSDASIVGSVDPVSTGPGAAFSLSSSNVTLNPNLTTNTKSLQNLADNSTVNTTYFSGSNGVVVNPFEPIYPKEIDNVSANGQVLRGVALRGGSYTDTNGVIPLTSAPTTETSTAHLSYNTEVFYPTQLWVPNYADAIGGGTTSLISFPAQFKSSAPGAIDGTLRKFNQLDMQMYYLPSNWTSGSATLKAAAVSSAPTILGASGVENGSQINFSVNTLAQGSAGVQAVWILYTGKPGSAYHGTWAPLDLTQNANDPTLWEGTLNLQPGENAENILFMVQAVGGAGLTTLATNLGAYYSVADENASQLPDPATTTLSFQSASASGTYLKNSSFTLSLQSNGQALASQLVSLDIGGQQAFGLTDSSGNVTLTLKLVVRPGSYTAQASFRGNADYLGSNATSAFTVNKDTTTLTVTPASASVTVNQDTPFVAVVKDSDGRALGGKSVFFVIHNGTDSFATSVIADFQGNASLGSVTLPAGVYTVDAYFNGTIPLSPSITLTDDYYESSSRLGFSLTLVVGDTTPPILNPVVSPNPVYLNGTAVATANATDSGSGIATQSCGPVVTNTVGTHTVTCTATDNAGNTATATVSYKVIYRFDGFLQPINDTGHTQTCGTNCTVSIFKGGSTVPVKFQLKDANGNVVQSASLPIWITPQKGNATSSPVDESVYSDPATSGNTYRLDNGKYIYNWSTKNFAAGYYWRIGVTLDDGQTYYVIVGLKIKSTQFIITAWKP